MSDYMIELCETMEAMTGADFDALMAALIGSNALADGFPNPNKKREMRKLYGRLQPYMDR